MAATAPAERIESIDILRGLALLGVLVVNLVGSFRVSFLQHFFLPDPQRSAHDRIADQVIRIAIEGKALTVFAFLFGAGLAIQLARLARTEEDPRARLRRRLRVLLAFGIAHLLLAWNGDILTEYAIIGLLAIPLLDAPDAEIKRWIVTMIVASILLPPMMIAFTTPGTEELRHEIAEATRVYAHGTYLEIRAHSLFEFLRLAPVLLGLLPQTLGVFLAGVLAWRRGYLREPEAHAPELLRFAAIGLGAGGALTLFNQLDAEGLALAAMIVTLPIAPLLLATGYAASLLLALRSERVRRALRHFASLGRMAFTNYIAQSLAFGFIFFGYGLGLFGTLGTIEALAIGAAFYALQLAFSTWWLARFRFGPLEWAWRSLTYGEPQPMRR